MVFRIRHSSSKHTTHLLWKSNIQYSPIVPLLLHFSVLRKKSWLLLLWNCDKRNKEKQRRVFHKREKVFSFEGMNKSNQKINEMVAYFLYQMLFVGASLKNPAENFICCWKHNINCYSRIRTFLAREVKESALSK